MRLQVFPLDRTQAVSHEVQFGYELGSIYAGELVSVPLLAFSRVSFCATLKNIFAAATSKSRLKNCTTGELETVPPQRSFFAPLKVAQFLTLEVVQFLTLVSLYVFPYLKLFGPFLKKKTKIIESYVGTSVVQFLAFENGGVMFYHLTFFLLFCFFFCCLLFSGFYSYSLLCYVSIVLTNNKASPKDKDCKNRTKQNSKETKKKREAKKETNK